MKARTAETAIAVLLAVGSAAVVATASASEHTGIAVSAASDSEQPGEPAPGEAETSPSAPPPAPGGPTERPTERHEGTATYYRPAYGMEGACGEAVGDGDFAVALDPGTFGSVPAAAHCGRKVVVAYEGKSVTATVLDAAPGAGRYGLALTRAAFAALAPVGQGSVHVTWYFAE
ncbi:RlpA-like double-psi beta-barrel domain-containing protein [Streptomyces sp. NPDC012794]|uniref:RlpA-like double-psi beta-barrel domain-containing protein n=1 Tax=Streptomyces sp. NPDC012794 TaxID=3364850 RepID=UPI0036A34E7B